MRGHVLWFARDQRNSMLILENMLNLHCEDPSLDKSGSDDFFVYCFIFCHFEQSEKSRDGFAIWPTQNQRITPYRFWIVYTPLAYFAQADARARLA